MATQQRQRSYRWNDAQAPTLRATDAFGTIRKGGNQTSLCFYKAICLEKNKEAHRCLARRAGLRRSAETGRRCRSHLLSDRCRKSLMASASLLQVGGRTERHAKAKNFTVSSNACRADRKVRMSPPRSSSLSPCDAHSRCTSRAGTTHRLTVTAASNER